MLSATQAAINRRTGWADWYINAFLMFLGALLVLTLLLLLIRPEGFSTVGLSILGGAVVGSISALVSTFQQLDEHQRQRKQSQLKLTANRFSFWRTFRTEVSHLALLFAWFGLAVGLIAALGGQ